MSECTINFSLKWNWQVNSYFEITTFFSTFKESRRVFLFLFLFLAKCTYYIFYICKNPNVIDWEPLRRYSWNRYMKISRSKIRIVHKCTCSCAVYANRATDIESAKHTATLIYVGLMLNKILLSSNYFINIRDKFAIYKLCNIYNYI